MNYKMLLSLVAIPTVTGSLITLPLLAMASAAEPNYPVQAIAASTLIGSCDLPQSKETHSILHRNSQISRETLIASAVDLPVENSGIDFSTAESDAAVVLFGCDCPACITALRQLRSQPSLSGSQGHCGSALQRRVSQQEVQEVLQTLEAEEAHDKP